MIQGEKSAALTGSDNLSAGQRQEGMDSFIEILDLACEKLMDRQIKYSIRRIREMDERLCVMERELDEFLSKKYRKP